MTDIVEALREALDSGTWAEVIDTLIALKGRDAVEVELAASQRTIERWRSPRPGIRPLTEKLLRRSIREWVGLPDPAEIERLRAISAPGVGAAKGIDNIDTLAPSVDRDEVERLREVLTDGCRHMGTAERVDWVERARAALARPPQPGELK
jgi:hypothetical protein